MSIITKQVAICTFTGAPTDENRITNHINQKWVKEQNDYYNSISDDKQTKYEFNYFTTVETSKASSKRNVWNKMAMVSQYLNEKNNNDDNDDDPENDYVYDYIIYIDPSAFFRVNNSYSDIFESIVTKYSCKNMIFSAKRMNYTPYSLIFFLLLLVLLLSVIVYIFSQFNSVFFITFISLLVVGLLIVLIVAAVDYNDTWSINSDVFILKNSKYSRNMVNYWLSSDCYTNRKEPFERHGCLRNTFINNINKIINNTAVLNYGTLERDQYKIQQESLTINLAGEKHYSKRLEELKKLQKIFNI